MPPVHQGRLGTELEEKLVAEFALNASSGPRARAWQHDWCWLAASYTLPLLERQKARERQQGEMNDSGQCQSGIDLDQNQNHWWPIEAEMDGEM